MRGSEIAAKLKRMLVHLIVIILVTLAVVILLVRLFEGSFIYFPTKYPTGRWDAGSCGLDAEDVYLTTGDNVRIHGWFVPAEGATHTVVLFHGNAGNLTDRIEKLALLHSLNVSVCAIDYRGYGRSEGRPGEAGLYADADAAYDYLCHELGVEPESIVLYGVSLGGAVAVDLACRKPVGAVILESTFTSAKDMARKALPFLPPELYLRTKLDSAGKIEGINAPLLLMHGTRDSTVPIEHARRLYEEASQPKTLVEIPGAAHNDMFVVAEQVYTRSLKEFLGQLREPQENEA
jgi:fermentation-respiration switch protein FrsA (DUF1100 family)